LLNNSQVSTHPFVIGEIALGNLRKRNDILQLLAALPTVVIASYDETLSFISNFSLAGRGLGYIDVHLLAAASLTPQTTLWTKDKRLLAVAHHLSIAAV
jgi:predicted nucleic acid-binding protein